MKTICLVAGSATMNDGPLPAKELYASNGFKKVRTWVERNGHTWYIMSEKHLLLEPDKLITRYDKSLNDMNRPERQDWANQVMEQLKPKLASGDHVIILAGARFREFLTPSLESMGVTVEAPLEGLRIGEQLSWLKEQNTMTTNVLNLSLGCDCPLVETGVPSQRLIEIVVKASDLTRRTERAPLNIALVIDRSGSMAGEKLPFVQQAACYVLDQLDERDRVAVVAYDDVVQRVASGKPLSSARRQDLKQRINALRPGGYTDLGGGWLRGAGEVADQLMAQGVNRVLLLTDGLANRGITDIEELTHHARELRQRGISTSTFGVGLDFNEHLLEALATQGGGHYYFIEHPRQIPDIFRRELGELLTVVARETTLTFACPPGTAVTLRGDLPHEQRDGRLRVSLGDVFAGEERNFFLQALTPPGAQGANLTFRAELAFSNLEGRSVETSAILAFAYAGASETQAAPRNVPLQQRASEVEMSAAETQALKLEREGKRKEAAQVVQQALEANAPTLPASASAAYVSLAEQLSGGNITEVERKQRHQESYEKRHSRK